MTNGKPTLLYINKKPNRNDTLIKNLDQLVDVTSCESENATEIIESEKAFDIVWLSGITQDSANIVCQIGRNSHSRIILYLWGNEIFEPGLSEVDWALIDDLIFPSELALDLTRKLNAQIFQATGRQHVLAPGIEAKTDRKLVKKDSRKMIFLADLNFESGPLLLFQAITTLLRLDPHLEIHLPKAGREQRYQLYLEAFLEQVDQRENILFYDEIKNLRDWCEDKTHVIATDLLNLSPLRLLEAMACGLTPLIHKNLGAELWFPEEAIWNSLIELEQLYARDDLSVAKQVEFIRERYSPEIQFTNLKELLSYSSRDTSVLHRRIEVDRFLLRRQIEKASKEKDLERFLFLWYQDHYLPKTKYNTNVNWQASARAMQSIKLEAKKNRSKYKRLAQKSKKARPAESKTLFVFELLDFENPVLRHFYNLIASRDSDEFKIDVVSRINSLDSHPRKPAIRSSEQMIRDTGCQVITLGNGSMIERVDNLIELILSGQYKEIVFHTGFQVSFLIYAAQVTKLLRPNQRLIGYLWDFIEKGTDVFCPYDHIITVFEPNRHQITKTPVDVMRYLYMDRDAIGDSSVNQDIWNRVEDLYKKQVTIDPVIFCTMVGQSIQRGNDPEFWRCVQDVLLAVPNSFLIVIGLTSKDLSTYIRDEILNKRILCTGFTKYVKDYLLCSNLYVDTFKTGGTSMWEAFDNGVPIFTKKAPFYNQPMYNFPEEFIVDKDLLLVDTVDDYGLWTKKLVEVLSNRPRLIEMGLESKEYALTDKDSVTREANRVFEIIRGGARTSGVIRGI